MQRLRDLALRRCLSVIRDGYVEIGKAESEAIRNNDHDEILRCQGALQALEWVQQELGYPKVDLNQILR